MGTCEMTEELYPCRECFGGAAWLAHFTSLRNLQFWLCSSDCSMLVAVSTGIWLWRSVRVCTLALLASARAFVTLAAASCWLWLSRMLFNSVWDFAQSRMVLSSGARFSRPRLSFPNVGILFDLACVFLVRWPCPFQIGVAPWTSVSYLGCFCLSCASVIKYMPLSCHLYKAWSWLLRSCLVIAMPGHRSATTPVQISWIHGFKLCDLGQDWSGDECG